MGIRPAAAIGHSVGEYAAACIAGIMSFEDALAMVIRRAELFEELPEGAMLSVLASTQELEPHLTAGLSVAVLNAPDLTVVSGPVEEIEAFAAVLPALGLEAQRVPIRVAAHSSMLEPILPRFREACESIALHPPEFPVASNVTGEWLTEEQACDPGYWVRQLRETVLFAEGIETVSTKADVFVEVGPGTVLSSLVKLQPFFASGFRVVRSMRLPKEQELDDRTVFYQALGDLWAAGVDIDWSRVHDDGPRRRVPLPTYPFEHSRHWIDAQPATHALGERLPVDAWCHQPVWEPRPGAAAPEGGPRGVLVAGAVDARIVALLGDVVEVRSEPTGEREALERALDALPSSHCWTLLSAIPSQEPGPAGLAAAVAGLHEQAVAVRDSYAALAGWRVLVSGAAPRGGSTESTNPIATATLAAARVIDSELDVNVRCIEIREDVPAEAILASLVEVDARPLALHGHERLVLEHRPLDVELRTSEPTERPGCCVVTGGLGELALGFAGALVSQGWRSFALVARRGLPEGEERAFYLSEGGAMARRMMAVEELESAGAAVRIWTADVADAPAMDRVWSEIESELGPVGLVLHTAGTLDDGVIGSKTSEEIERVLAPKAAGHWLVEKMDAPLVLFSSTSSIAGLPGQFAYAAANGYLDGLALRARARKVLSVGWGAWKDSGMAARLAGAVPTLDDAFVGGQRRRDGTFERVVSGREWAVSEHRTRSGTTLMPGTGLLSLLASAQGEAPVALKNVSLLQPLLLDSGARRIVQVGRDGDRVTLRSAADARAAEVEDWLGDHVEAEATAPTAVPAALDIASLRARCPDVALLPGRSPEHAQMSFGPRWACLDSVRYGRDEALVEASLDPSFADDLDAWLLHPALLDVATGAAQELLPDFEPTRDFFVPQSYGRLDVFGGLPASVVSHVRLADSSAESCTLDVTVADEDGRVVVELRRFRLRRMPASVLDDLMRVDDVDAEDDPRENPLADAIRGEEGFPLLQPLVDSIGSGSVIVSPLPVAELHRRAAIHLSDADPSDLSLSQVDRPSLATPYVAPANELEQTIAEVWQEALGFSSVGTEDNFFALGGHSLLLTKVASRLRKQVGLTAPLSDLFETPTISHWASTTAGSEQPGPTVSPLGRISRDAYTVSD
jgi:NAD(P)-dependent dehydrogenase (short-subunit alcohol dehydrogenase family)/aryl carrier-like protein